MCNYCDMSQGNINIVEVWGENGLTYTKLTVLFRYANTYPNTFVFIFENTVTINGTSKDIFVDVHYSGNQATPGA